MLRHICLLYALCAAFSFPGSIRAEVDERRLAALDNAIASDTFRRINSVIAMRDGEPLIERYYNGADREQLHDPRSVSKTFASAVLGIAIAEGHIRSVDQTLGEFYELEKYANYSDKKSRVTLRHLLTMRSGFEAFDFDPASVGNEEHMYPTQDWVKWALDLPMAAERNPGEAWRYFTGGVVLLGDILNRSVPGGLENYAHEKLFGPLGIDNYEWQHTPQRIANTAGGMQMTPLGFARFGELYLQGGRWGGRQFVPVAWVDASLTAVVDSTVPGDRYGYLWWHKTYTMDGEEWPVWYCSGNGGNKIFVFREYGLVVVVTASAYGQRYMHTQVDDMMQDYILPALSPAVQAPTNAGGNLRPAASPRAGPRPLAEALDM